MKSIVRKKHIKKVVAFVAAVAVMLSATVFAASKLLTPQEIAKECGNYKLAEAFSSEDIKFNIEPRTSGDYTVQLLGIMTGKRLSQFEPDISADADRSYIVGAISRTDGQKLGEDFLAPMLSPLVSGYKPWEVNIFTLGGGKSEFMDDYTDYFVYECDNLEVFADHTIYIAVYEGIAPGAETFTMSEDGTIRFNESYDGAGALFTLPESIFDKSKANPQAAAALLSGKNDDADLSDYEGGDEEYAEAVTFSYSITDDGVTEE